MADLSKTIAENYGVLAGNYDMDDEGNAIFIGRPQAYRGLFLINKEGTIRHCVINDMPLGRSVGEALRMLDAMIFNEENGEVCPADWKEGEEAMEGSHEGVSAYLSKNKN